MAVMSPPVISMSPAPLLKNVPLPIPAEPPLPLAVRLPVLRPSVLSDVMVSLPVVPVLSSLCSRPAHWLPLMRVLLPSSLIVVSPAPSTLRAASLVWRLLASMLTPFSVTLRVLSSSLPVHLLMILMTLLVMFSAVLLKLSSTFSTVWVELFGVSSSSLALVYVSTELLRSVLLARAQLRVVGVPPVLVTPVEDVAPRWTMALFSPYSDVSAVNLDWAGEVAEVVPVVVPGSVFWVVSVPVPPLMMTLPSLSRSPSSFS